MVTTLTKNEMYGRFVGSAKSDVHVIDFDLIKTVENKIIDIINEDKELVNPVFLFVHDEVISKLAYFLAGYARRSVAIGIAGGTASGKSTIAFDIMNSISKFQQKFNLGELITRVNTDDYYYDRSEQVKEAGSFVEFAKNYDLDVPAAFELDLLKRHIEQLVLGREVWLPKYDMSGTAIRIDNHTKASPNKIIITEGLFTLTDIVRDVFDFTLYVHVSTESQKERWFKRAAERNLVGEQAEKVYENAVSKAEIHVKPTAQKADIIVNGEVPREAYRSMADKFLELATNSFYLSNCK